MIILSAAMPRIDHLLARNLGIGRRLATRLFRGQRVRGPDGAVLRDPSLRVAPSALPWTVTVDTQEHTLHARYHLLQHKPRGVVTALHDRHHPTVRELLAAESPAIPLLGDLRPVGRLDRDVSGLLFWTTEGELLHRLTHPRYAVPRVYQAALARPYSPPPRDRPLTLDDGYQPTLLDLRDMAKESAHPALAIPPETAALATITVGSGHFHEVKRIFAALGSEVLGLCRVAYGGVELPSELAAGASLPIDLNARFAGLHPRA